MSYNFIFTFFLFIVRYHAHELNSSFSTLPGKDKHNLNERLAQFQNNQNQPKKIKRIITDKTKSRRNLSSVKNIYDLLDRKFSNIFMRNVKDIQMDVVGDVIDTSDVKGFSYTWKENYFLSKYVIFIHRIFSFNLQTFTLSSLALVTMIYSSFLLSRNGILISSILPFISGRWSTIFNPHKFHLHDYIISDKFMCLKSSLPKKFQHGVLVKAWDGICDNEDKSGVSIANLTTKEKNILEMVITARISLPFEFFIPTCDKLVYALKKHEMAQEDFKLYGEKEDCLERFFYEKVRYHNVDHKNMTEKPWEYVMMLSFNSIKNVFDSRRFSQCVENSCTTVYLFSPFMSNISRIKEEGALLVAKSMGIFGRYGIQPLSLIIEDEKPDSKMLIYSSLDNGFYDGELVIKVKLNRGIDDDDDIIISATFLIPKNGRCLSRMLYKEILQNLVFSIAKSSMIDANNTITDRLHSMSYQKSIVLLKEKCNKSFGNIYNKNIISQAMRQLWERLQLMKKLRKSKLKRRNLPFG